MNNFSMLTPAMRDNPWPLYALARQMSPVLWRDEIGMWSVFSAEACRTVLRNPQVFSSDPTRLQPDIPRERQSMLTTDPPRHTQLRNLVNQAFTPRRVAALQPRIAEIANGILDAALPSGRLDVIEDLAYPLPVIIIAELLGVPSQDRADFKRWSDIVVKYLGTEERFTTLPDEIRQVQEEFQTYFEAQIEDHRRNPKDDLIGALLQAEIDGRRLSADELLSFCILLLVAGNETTTNLIGNAVRCLLEHPAEMERVRADLSLVPSAVEETLRFRSPVQATIRILTQDYDLAGSQLQAGQRVVVWLGAANRDPAEFPDPDRFDAGRDPNRHLAFGLGIHFCLGAPLARLEAQVALDTILRRLPPFERADQEPFELVEGFIMHGVKHLPVRFAPVPAGASV